MDYELSAAARRLARRIQQEGPIPFADFMGAAVGDPQHGYYARKPLAVGREGDFISSVSIHPLFGQCLAVQLAEMAEQLGGEAFHVVEFGGGQGTLCLDILGCLKEEFPAVFSRCRYWIVEVVPPPPSFWEGADRLGGGCRKRLRWLTPGQWNGTSVRFQGCVLAQEFLDALPVHRVVRGAEGWREIYVDFRDGGFREILGPLSRVQLREFCRRAPSATGISLEINLAAVRWIEELSLRLERGFVLIVDYGGWGLPGLSETLSCHFRHVVHYDPYRWVAEQDLTAHVDFHSLTLAAHKAGFSARGLVSQGKFLFNLGIVERATRTWDPEDPAAGLKERLALKTLTLPGGMGDRFWTLILERSVGEARLRGLGSESEPHSTADRGGARTPGRSGGNHGDRIDTDGASL